VLISLRRGGSTDTDLSLSCRGGRCWLFDGNWIGCRKGILERIVERLFLMPTRSLRAIVFTFKRLACRTGIHLPPTVVLGLTCPTVRAQYARVKQVEQTMVYARHATAPPSPSIVVRFLQHGSCGPAAFCKRNDAIIRRPRLSACAYMKVDIAWNLISIDYQNSRGH